MLKHLRAHTTPLRIVVVLIFSAATIAIFVLLQQSSEAASEIRAEAREMLALVALQERLLATSGVVSKVVVPNPTVELAELDSTIDHGDMPGAPHARHLVPEEGLSNLNEETPFGDHVQLSDHPALVAAFAEMHEATARVRTLMDDGDSEVVAPLLTALEAYEASVADLHAAGSRQDLMTAYHLGPQASENAVRGQILELLVEEANHLQLTIERSRAADGLMRTVVPLLVAVTAALVGHVLVGQGRRRRLEVAALETANREKDDFLATVSHELRTPLTGVRGYLDILRDPAFEASDRERLGMIDIVSREAVDLSDLVDDLLVIAKADQGGLTVSSEQVDLVAQVAQVLEGLGVTERISISGEGPDVIADSQRVRQVIRNLVTNALKYGGPDVCVGMTSDGQGTSLQVSDDGDGVPTEEEGNIFDPYHRAHSAPGVTGSMGLGLAVSRRLALAMGGTLTYARISGRTTFTLWLPRTSSHSSSQRVAQLSLVGHSQRATEERVPRSQAS